MVLSVGILDRHAAQSRPLWISQVPWRFLFRPCRALRPRRSLQRPSPLRSPTVAFQIFDPVGLRMCHEAQSLHLRYSPDVALPTLSPCCCLHEPKARFQVRRLVPLAWAGIAPTESARLSLAHRKIFPNRGQPPSRSLPRCTVALELPLDGPIVPGESHSCSRSMSSPTSAAAPASPLAG